MGTPEGSTISHIIFCHHVMGERRQRAHPVSPVAGGRLLGVGPICSCALGGRCDLCKSAGQGLLKALLAAICLPAIDDKDVQGKAVTCIKCMRLADIQPQVSLHNSYFLKFTELEGWPRIRNFIETHKPVHLSNRATMGRWPK